MLKYTRRWHEMYERCRMKKDELKMAHWARVELRRKGRSMNLQWPASAARECALLLRELMK